MRSVLARTTCALSLTLLHCGAFAAAPKTIEELWQIVQRQQAQIETLQAELRETRQVLSQTTANTEAIDARVAANRQYKALFGVSTARSPA